ncbi:MAG: phosphoenolpyruvate carboxykinase (GTP) [Verrucomicrobia bacterium]|nr:phosphoenolpyruvate carboxykinase (GTP) [Verrucomicrobiota bacterium]MBS0645490.1 phosphoenolpyruvate carboxykinase (GTP) [Verrucomicrobiota bacterium]
MLDELRHQKLKAWIQEIIELCRPTKIVLCEGSEQEARLLCEEMVKKGTLIALDEKKRPGSFLARSNPKDVARVEERTFICSKTQIEAGPTNNWRDPDEMLTHLQQLFQGCMHGRTMYVVAFSMGPIGSHFSRVGVQLTDSPYAVINMRLMTRMGKDVLDILEEDGEFVPCVHSVGVPLPVGQKDVPWPCSPEKTVIAHFPHTKSIWSFGSGYGGNALLGKKCFALRIASYMGKEEKWLAEHMLIVGITNPNGKKRYVAAAFPSACGKTNLAMMQAALPGWKVECVGDDIAWMHLAEDGRLYAINPEAGFFGVAPGTSQRSNPNALATCRKNAIFTNVALTSDKDVWWEGLTSAPPEGVIDWQGMPWQPGAAQPAAHPNSRFTASASQCPIIDPHWEDPQGVPISAIIFGGRRSNTIPLVAEALDWEHGTFMGACVSSETTAAAAGDIGKLRHDPFAMLPFCGYNMADYFQHWLDMGKLGIADRLPRIYSVNWFNKDAQGQYIWPGFGDNIRVLKWIFERLDGTAAAKKTPIGYLPQEGSLDLSGLQLSPEQRSSLISLQAGLWQNEMKEMRSYFQKFADRLPKPLLQQLERIEQQLASEKV